MSGIGKFNSRFYELRKQKNWSQDQLSVKLKCTRVMVTLIENGERWGKISFWRAVQKAFDIPNEDMWEIMNGIEHKENS